MLKLFQTILMFISENGHIEFMKLLLAKEGIDINAKNIKLFSSIFILII